MLVAALFLLGTAVIASERCKYDNECNNVFCKLRHGMGMQREGLIGWVAREGGYVQEANCNIKEGCSREQHNTGRDPYGKMWCRDDDNCSRRNCHFAHTRPICLEFLKREPHKDPSVHRSLSHPNCYQACRRGRHLGNNPEFLWPEFSQRTRTKRAPAKGKGKGNRPCRNGDACHKKSCTFAHPSGAERDGLKRHCRNGDECWNADCSFRHPSGDSRSGLTDPPRTCYKDEDCNNFGCQYMHTQGDIRVGLGKKITQTHSYGGGSVEYWNGGAAFGGKTLWLNGWEDNYSVSSCEDNYGGNVTDAPVVSEEYFQQSYPWSNIRNPPW